MSDGKCAMRKPITVEEAKEAFRERYNNKRRDGVPIDARGASEENDVVSGLAEKFACEYFGSEPNYETLKGGDEGYDFVYRGYKIDAKWLGVYKGTQIPRKEGRIMIDRFKIDKADLFVGVSGSESFGFRCVAWCTKEDLLKEELWRSSYPDKNNDYFRYAIHTKKARKMKDLLEITPKRNLT